MSEYVPEKYATWEDIADQFGWTKTQIEEIDEETKNRFINWTRQGCNNVETALLPYINNESLPLTKGSKEYTFAHNAVISWAEYKRRDKDGSKNATNAKKDSEKNIADIITYLTATRTSRTKTVAILGKSQTGKKILLPSQIDTQFY